MDVEALQAIRNEIYNGMKTPALQELIEKIESLLSRKQDEETVGALHDLLLSNDEMDNHSFAQVQIAAIRKELVNRGVAMVWVVEQVEL